MATLGIVGAEAGKFTRLGEQAARAAIHHMIKDMKPSLIISGGCHLGGIDIWAEEAAAFHGIPTRIHLPKTRSWSGGYRERNLLIAQDSDVLRNIVVDRYPANFRGMTFPSCYHCHSTDHVKSGGCWTALRARALGKDSITLITPNPEDF